MSETESVSSRIYDNRSIYIKFDPRTNEDIITKRVHSFLERCLLYLEKKDIELPAADVIDILFLSRYNSDTKRREPMGLGYIHFSHKMLFDIALGNTKDQILGSDIVPIGRYLVNKRTNKKKYKAYEVSPITFSAGFRDFPENLDKDMGTLFGIVPGHITYEDLLILFSVYSSDFSDHSSLEYPRINMMYNPKNNTNKVFVEFNPNTNDAIFARNMFKYRIIDAYWGGSEVSTSAVLKFDFAITYN